MTDQANSSVGVSFWRQMDSGAWVEEAADTTETLVRGGWAGEVEVVAESLLDDAFVGIAIVIDVDDKGIGSIMDVLTVRPEHKPTRVII